MAFLAGLALPASAQAPASASASAPAGATPGGAVPQVAAAAADPAAAGPVAGVVPGETAGWVWPLSPRPAVVHPFDPPARRWLAGHRGVDLAGAIGAAVLAPADGVVTFAGRVAGRPVLSLSHEGGLRSTYEPVMAALPVGSAVRAGDVVGYLSTEPGHCAPAACLHWGALRGSTYVDPLALLGRPPVILLPVP